MDENLPKTIAGYQHVEHGNVHYGDIWVKDGTPYCQVSSIVVGVEVSQAENYACGMGRIYRKIPVANPGDLDEAIRERGALSDKCVAFSKEYDKEEAEREKDKAKTHDEGKPPLANLPWAGIREVAMVQLYGHKKYSDWNNYRKGMEVSRNLSCAIRHISEYMDGNNLDSESGRSHLAHAACRILFVLQNEKDGTAIDDRFKPTKK